MNENEINNFGLIILDNGKSPMHKSSIDVISMSTNNIHVGATSSLWNTEGRDGGKKFTTSLDLFGKIFLLFVTSRC